MLHVMKKMFSNARAKVHVRFYMPEKYIENILELSLLFKQILQTVTRCNVKMSYFLHFLL